MILDNANFSKKLFSSIENCQSSFLCCSAFIKTKALQYERFGEELADKDVTIISRWQKNDLICGASDLSTYEYCKEKGWNFGIDLNLHGKFFIIDREEIYLGSANLTQKGLHIGLTGNNEFGTKIPASQADLEKIDAFINSEVTWMNDSLYKLISEEVYASKEKQNHDSSGWPQSIFRLINKPVCYLWVQELVFATPVKLLQADLSNEKVLHDFELLGLPPELINESSLKSAFQKTKLFRWLYSVLEQKSLSFGGITALLHSAILDDPKPYRINVKTSVQLIFKWAEFMDDSFLVTQPNHSQVLTLKK